MNMREEINEIEKDIEEIEKAAIHAISQIVCRVEEVTGQQFQSSAAQTGIKVTGPPVVNRTAGLPNAQGYRGRLANYVRITASQIREGWGFKDPCEFNDWAEPHFRSGWNSKYTPAS